MTYAPKFSARFEGPFIDNTLAIIVRDFKLCLDYFYASDALPDFAERAIGTEQGLEFPMMVIGPRSNQVETADDAARLIEPIVIEIKIGVTAVSANEATRKIMKYVRVMDAVLRTATKADYCAGMATRVPFGFYVDVTHEYGPLGANENRTTFFKPASLQLTIHINEGR